MFTVLFFSPYTAAICLFEAPNFVPLYILALLCGDNSQLNGRGVLGGRGILGLILVGLKFRDRPQTFVTPL